MSLYRYCLYSLIALFAFPLSVLAERAPGPKIIAHRAGTDDAPENTLFAIEESLRNKADAIWITIQLSKDNVPVLYRPRDLSANTNLKGAVSSFSAEELAQADAGYNFQPKKNFPYRHKNITVPTLEQVLTRYPHTFFYLDIKSPDADPAQMTKALMQVLKKHHALERIRVYSTESKFLQALPPEVPKFVSRDSTRQYLVETLLNGNSCPPSLAESGWHGFELYRKVKVVERFTLGEGVSEATLAWSPQDMQCFKQSAQHIILFGINGPEEMDMARRLGADGVMVNSPKLFKSPAQD
ncbi:glycerophosphoryl diester phosphodiesterase [Mesocricetibacter intestinalis]|uniref:Glycerophosphoryl diester phosphodiesterase n=1 Tax=Mesocricetibacter intestinalis TaxID=1521930 RepID=A0A4R6VKU8_9PAST|nr:glycerophosphodiester phosphodiesterase family protein [Mesocricetibacter intestinalis]TDQ59430.1 glycerophosphoryl diester phosphodiesterase [Mesocricetibacter intestinalis]